jgi:hypothetical protein
VLLAQPQWSFVVARGREQAARVCRMGRAGSRDYELVGTPAKINFCTAELAAVEGQNFSVHTLAAIRLFYLVCDDDFIAGLDESNKFEHSAFSCTRPATFKIPCAVQVWIRWRGKGIVEPRPGGWNWWAHRLQ